MKSKISISKRLILATLMMLGLTYNAIAQSELEGDWQTGEDNTVIRVVTTDGVATGKMISTDYPNAKLGIAILRDFKQVKGIWTGQIFAAAKGKLYDATISPDASTLHIKVTDGFLSKKLAWKRAEKPVEK